MPDSLLPVDSETSTDPPSCQRAVVVTHRDHEIVLGLNLRARVFALRQIADHWFSGDLANTRRRLKSLARLDLVRRITVSARSLPSIEEPVSVWQSGQSAPHFGKVSYQLRKRWARWAVRSTTAYIATERAARLLGGKLRGQLRHPTQATHDLGVAAVWLTLDRNKPEWAVAWRGEDLLAHTRRGQKLPDAFLVNDSDEPLWAIEFGGSYDPKRVEDFHDDCATRNLSYQIW